MTLTGRRFFLRFRQATFDKFEDIFNTGNEEKEFSTDGLTKKWGWYNAIYMLANESFLNVEQIVKKPAYECLTFMSYKKDVNQKLENEYRRHKI